MLPGIGVFGTTPEVKHLVKILREKGFRIEAIWGRTLKEAEEVARSLAIPFHTNKVDDVLLKKDVDLVFIICAPFLHSQISVKALGIGKHVVCDKPMGLGQPDALKMVRASQYYPSLISLANYSLRFLPAFVHMKRLLSEEFLGPLNEINLIGLCSIDPFSSNRLYRCIAFVSDVRIQMSSMLHEKFDWLCDAAMGGGVLNLIGSHIIDLVSFLIGIRANRVHGIVKTYNKNTSNINGIRQITAPDFCNFQMEFEDSTMIATVSIQSNESFSNLFQEVSICGRDGRLIARDTDLFGRRKENSKESTLFKDVDDSDDVSVSPYVKGLDEMIGALRLSFAQEQSSWIKEPVKSAATFEDALYVQAVLDAIRKSNESKNWIKVNIMSESPTNHAKIMTAARMSAVVMH